MLVELSDSDVNEITVHDVSTGANCKYFYRSITTADRLKYRSKVINEYVQNQDATVVQEIQMDFVLSLLTGFDEDLFSVNGKAISSNPKNKYYHEGWREIIKNKKSDHLISICSVLLDEPNYVLKKNSLLIPNSKPGKMPGQKKRNRNT